MFTFYAFDQISQILNGLIFEPTCADARWAHMPRFLSVRLSVCD